MWEKSFILNININVTSIFNKTYIFTKVCIINEAYIFNQAYISKNLGLITYFNYNIKRYHTDKYTKYRKNLNMLDN